MNLKQSTPAFVVLRPAVLVGGKEARECYFGFREIHSRPISEAWYGRPYSAAAIGHRQHRNPDDSSRQRLAPDGAFRDAAEQFRKAAAHGANDGPGGSRRSRARA